MYARALRTKPTGRGMLAREMVQALGRVRPDVEIHLFSGEDPGWNGVSWRPATGSGLAGEAWRSFRGIARDVAGIHPDAIWSATHVLPYGLPADLPKIVTLLDVVWRDHPETMSPRNRTSRRGRSGDSTRPTGLRASRRSLAVGLRATGRSSRPKPTSFTSPPAAPLPPACRRRTRVRTC